MAEAGPRSGLPGGHPPVGSPGQRRPGLPGGPYLVVGLARSGVAAALALRARGERVIGLDAGAPTGLDALADAGVELHTGCDGAALLDGVGCVVKSPGVPAEAPVVAQARTRGICTIGELELGWRMLPGEFVAVTGTNGKTTTVELIGHIHRRAGLPVAVAGNVGVALSGLAGSVDPRATIVCEVSSFQLEDTLAFAPEAAVLLNFAPDHLDRHHTLEDYLRAKLRIFAHQRAGDVAVVPAGFEHPLPGAARRIEFGEGPDVLSAERGGAPGVERGGAHLVERDGALWWEGRALLDLSELSLRGRHNRQNAMASAAVCLARGLDPDAVRDGLRSFQGVPHRLEEVARRDGVLYVNDSKATNIASAQVALDAFAPGTIHLILGGQGKGQDFAALRERVLACCRAVYLIGQDGPQIARALRDGGVTLHESATLERALAQASAAAHAGEVVLLSPGCASFDQFVDYEARGERFRELVHAL